MVLALTAVIWYQARGLEERVLEAIQPHLLTDVQVGSVALTVWDSWPNVEVVLGNVWIEDAVEEGKAFVELKTLGVVFAWQPLLFGRLELAEVEAKGGRINVKRYPDGRENWQFWKLGDDAEGVDWTVGSLALNGVQLDGEWWSEGHADPVLWSALCRSISLDLTEGNDQDWMLQGPVVLGDSELLAGGETWLDVVNLEAAVNMTLEGADVAVSLSDAQARTEQGSLDFKAILGSDDGFSLALLCQGAQGATLLSLVPPGLIQEVQDLPEVSGAADVEVLVGSGRLPGGWAGPTDSDWTEDWAVRIAPQSLVVGWKGLPAKLNGGELVACSQKNTWSLVFDEVIGQAADGEFRCSGSWSSGNGVDDLVIRGEMVARPEGVMSWLGEEAALPDGWKLKPGGVLRAEGNIAASRSQQQPWSWSQGTFEATITDVGLVFQADQAGAAPPLNVGEARVMATPKEWELYLGQIRGWGVAGDVNVSQPSGVDVIQVAAQASSCDLTELLAAVSDMPSGSDQSNGNGPNVDWSLEVDQITWGLLSARSVGAQGTFNVGRQEGVLNSLSAQAFDGLIDLGGIWDQQTLALEGRVVDADFSSFLEGTQGLGQSTLLPSHVRGRVWADGMLKHHFQKAVNLAWETDLGVRIEEGELLDFELLQRIPETLKEEGKYRFISDAEDLSKRLKRVRFKPLEARVSLKRGVFTLDPTEVMSDAMDVGIAGWQRLSGGMDYTLDFALRDLKSDEEEFGTTADDGLGHRFFLAIGGTLEAPEFGYDRAAHKTHRQGERRSALGRLRGLILGEDMEQNAPQNAPETQTEHPVSDSVQVDKTLKVPPAVDVEDDDDDFSP